MNTIFLKKYLYSNYLKFAFIIILIAFLSIRCGGSGDTPPGNEGGDTPAGNEEGSTFTNGLSGVVEDITGTSIAGVEISCAGLSATCGNNGSFHLELAAGTDQIVLFNRDGYVATIKSVDINEDSLTSIIVTMITEAPSQKLNASTGGTVISDRNASLIAGSNSFVDSSGNTVTGEVDVHITPLDPTLIGEASAYPGYLIGISKDDEEVILQTYGVMDVTVKKDGERLQVASGKTVDIKIPAPSGVGNQPSTMQMWYFDMESCLWIQHENDGTYDPVTKTYSVTIDHLSWENSDNAFMPTCIHGKVVDSEGEGVYSAYITAQAYGYGGVYSWMHTDINGNYCMTVEQEQTVLLTIEYNNIVTTRVITAGKKRSTNYPANCGGDDCKHIRSIEIGTDDPGEGSEADCEINSLEGNPFLGTCAEGLGDFFQCFSPEGNCSYVIDLGTDDMPPLYEMNFQNGSKIKSDVYQGNLMYYGPSGTFCGTITYEESGATKVSTRNGMFIIRTTHSGGVEIECPGGDKFIIDASQEDLLIGCTGQAGNDDSGVACEPEPGSFMAECDFTIQCDSEKGYECCGDFFEKKCLPSSMCDAYENSCDNDLDCTTYGHDWICCDTGFFKQCIPFDYCN